MRHLSIFDNFLKNDLFSVIFFLIVVISVSILGFIISSEIGFSFLPYAVLFFGGIYITYLGFKYYYLRSFSKWLNCLSAYTIFIFLIFIFFWYLPLRNLGDLQTSQQLPDYQDANYYDYLADLAAESPFSEWGTILNSTWLSQGIITYLALIYKLFGVSQFNYLPLNILLGYISVISIQSIIVSSKNDNLKGLLFLPFVAYYFVTPGKEVLTNSLTYFTLCLFWNLRTQRSSRVGLKKFVVVVSLLSLGLIRLNAMFLTILFLIIYSLIHSQRKVFMFVKSICYLFIIFSILFFFNLHELIFSIIDADSHISQFNIRLQNVQTDSIKLFLSTALTNENILLNMALSPLRMLVWLIAPFPFLGFGQHLADIITGGYYQIFRAGEMLARSLSTLIILVTFILSKNKFLFVRQIFQDNGPNFIFLAGLIFSVVLSTTNFIEGARYRTFVEPLFYGVALFLLHKNKNFKKDATL
jgi:hypothetical protein